MRKAIALAIIGNLVIWGILVSQTYKVAAQRKETGQPCPPYCSDTLKLDRHMIEQGKTVRQKKETLPPPCPPFCATGLKKEV